MCMNVSMEGYICVYFVLLGQVGQVGKVGSELYSTVDLSPFTFPFCLFFSFHAHIRCILNLNTSCLPT